MIEELRGEVFSLNEELNCITEQVDRQEPNSRRNCFLIHGTTEESQENTDALALEFFKEKLDIEITQQVLDRTHWMGKNDKNSKRPRPVIVKFIQYNDRKKVFSKKKQLKSSGISIRESVTKLRMGELAKVSLSSGMCGL